MLENIDPAPRLRSRSVPKSNRFVLCPYFTYPQNLMKSVYILVIWFTNKQTNNETNKSENITITSFINGGRPNKGMGSER